MVISGVEILFIASIFTSSDIIAAITIVKFEDFPKLFSIILGEGLANDAVAIILFDTMREFEFDDAEFEWTSTPFKVIMQFLALLVMSTAIGLIFGIGASLMTKKFRFISSSAIAETFLLLCSAMFSYFLSVQLGFSGIVTVLINAVTLSHYCWYNLSP